MDDVAMNYDWFDQHRDEVIADHHGEFALIHGCHVVGYFKTEKDGIEYARSNAIPLGSFALQRCVTEQEETGFYANWRVRFA